MKRTSFGILLVACALALTTNRSAFAVVLVNPGFDVDNAGSGDVPGATGWSSFNSTFTTTSVLPHSAPNTLKVFGPFFNGGGAGVVQGGFAASAGQQWGASSWARIDSSDPMNPANFAVVQLQFLDGSNNVLVSDESPHITTSSLPVNTWTQFSAGGIAPANTAKAQIVLVHVQLATPVAGGSIFFDDAKLGTVPEPATLTLLGIAVGCFAVVRRRGR